MFTVSNAIKNIRRHSHKSILYTLICIIAVLTVQVYIAGIDRTEAQLRQLPGAIPISARVASLDASRFAGLQITEKTVDGLQGSAYVMDLELTVLFRGGIGDFSPDDYRDHLKLNVVGINTATALEGLTSGDARWLPGYDSDILSGSDSVCIIDSDLMENYGWSLGDIIQLNLYRYRYLDRGIIQFEPLVLNGMQIVGEADLSIVAADMDSPQVVIPFESGRLSYHRAGVEFFAASAFFHVRNGLELNDFKAEMKTIQLEQFNPAKDVSMMVIRNRGTALLVNDATFISAATRLQESLSLLKRFLPLLAASLAAIGYFVAYLMIQNQREEFAVLRLLGMSKRESMALYLAEISVLTLSGSLVGLIISTASGITGFVAGIWGFALFSICFILGSIIALMRLGGTNVMLALSRSE